VQCVLLCANTIKIKTKSYKRQKFHTNVTFEYWAWISMIITCKFVFSFLKLLPMKPGKLHQTKHPAKGERKNKEREPKSKPKEQNPKWVSKGQRNKLCSRKERPADSGVLRIWHLPNATVEGRCWIPVKSWSQGLTAYNDHDVISCSNLTAMILKYRAKKKGRPLQKHKSSPWNTRYGPFFGHHIMLFQVLADYTKKILAAHYAFKEFVPETGFFSLFLVGCKAVWMVMHEDDDTSTKLGEFIRICHSYYQWFKL